MNVWLALRGATHALIQARLLHGQGQEEPPPYNGPVAERHFNLFRTFHDFEVVQGLFKKKGSGNAGYTLYSVNIPLGFDEDGNPDTAIIDDLQATYPGAQVLVLGAWDNEGLPFGMSWETEEVQIGGDPVLDENGDPVLDENGDPVLTPIETVTQRTGNLLGTPVYADDTNLLDFIPDDVTYDEDGNETSRTDAVAPKQVNVLAGQKPRRFVKSDGSDW